MNRVCAAISLFFLSASVSVAQTGFSAKTYPAVLPAPSDNTQLLTADFNNDGSPDLLAFGTRTGDYALKVPPGYVFENDRSGGFLAPQPLEGVEPMIFAQVADVNGDGSADIVGCTNTGSDRKGSFVLVYTNKGNGTFSYFDYGFVNGQCRGLTLGDVYHTGHTDIVMGGTLHNADGTITNQLTILKNDGKGNFTPQLTQLPVLDDATTSINFTNCGLISVVGADFQQNGQFSLLITTQCQAQVQNAPQNAGTTYFATPNASAANGNVYSFTKVASAYDLYENGQIYQPVRGQAPNVVYTGSQSNGYGDVTYARNDGAPAFTFATPYKGVIAGQTVGNLNTDNYPDFAVSEQDVTTANGAPEITILSGTSSQTFTKSQTFNTGSAGFLAGGILAVDVNNDGLTDLATLIYDSSSKATSLAVYTNTQTNSGSSCSAPTTLNTNVICSPSKGSTVTSSVTVTAASNVSAFTLNRLYLDNNSIYQVASQSVNTSITVTSGSHTLVLVSYNSAGKAFTTSTSFIVGTSTPAGCIPAKAGASICAPAAGSTASSPVTITAGALAASGYITAIRAYIDNVVAFTTNNPTAAPSQQVSQSVTVTPGSHKLVIVGYQSTGGSVTSTETFTATGTAACTASPQGSSVTICTPTTTATGSPFTVSAASHTYQGTIAAVRVYLDNVAVALVTNPQKTTSFSINPSVSASAGTHNLVVVAYPTAGASFTARETITVQ